MHFVSFGYQVPPAETTVKSDFGAQIDFIGVICLICG